MEHNGTYKVVRLLSRNSQRLLDIIKGSARS